MVSQSPSPNHLNDKESFSLSTIPGPDLAGRPGRCRRPRGSQRTRGRQECSASAVQPTASAPSFAVTRSPPSPFKSRTVKRTKRPSADVDRTVAVHNDVEIAQQAGAAHLAAAAPSYAADARSLPTPLQPSNDKRSSAVGKRGVDARIKSAETISCVIEEEGCIFLFTSVPT